MSIENSSPEETELDLSTEEAITAVLEKGDVEELKKVAEKFNLTPDRVERYSKFAQLRKETIISTRAELDARMRKKFNPTPAEVQLGAYKEVIESQVREAVFLLREKGYPTFESGFGDLEGAQQIGLTESVLDNIKIDTTLAEELASQGIHVDIQPDKIRLTFERFCSLPEIESAWNEVAKSLPSLGTPIQPQIQTPTKVNYSGFFS